MEALWDHELSNGMKVQSDDTRLRLAIHANQVIDLAEPKLSETYLEVYQEWQSHYANGELERIIHNIVAEREDRQDTTLFSNCYLLTPKWHPPPEAIGGGLLKPLWEKQRREAKSEERKALFLLAVFLSIVESIEEVQHTWTYRTAHHAQFKKNFLEQQEIQVLDEWNWNELDLSNSFVFNAGIDPDQLAIVMDLEPALLFTEHLPSLTEDNPGGLNNNFEAFEAMKAKFLPSYVQYDVAATEHDVQGDTEARDSESESLGIKASALFHKQPEASQADWDNEHAEHDEYDEHDPHGQDDESHPDFSQWDQQRNPPFFHNEWVTAGGDIPEIETQVEPEWAAEDGSWHQDGSEEKHEDAEEHPNGWDNQ